MGHNIKNDGKKGSLGGDSADYQEQEDRQETLLIEDMKKRQARKDEAWSPQETAQQESKPDQQK